MYNKSYYTNNRNFKSLRRFGISAIGLYVLVLLGPWLLLSWWSQIEFGAVLSHWAGHLVYVPFFVMMVLSAFFSPVMAALDVIIWACRACSLLP